MQHMLKGSKFSYCANIYISFRDFFFACVSANLLRIKVNLCDGGGCEELIEDEDSDGFQRLYHNI